MSGGHQFRPLNTWYVAKNGLNTGTGGPLDPVLTVTEALTRAQAVAGSQPQVIYVNPGTYTEGTLTITKGYVTIIGMAPSQSVNGTTTIVSNININITSPANNLYGNQVVFSNITLSQIPGVATSVSAIADVSTKQHSVILKNTQVYGRNCLLDFNPSTAADGRLYIEDCEFVQSSEAVPVAERSPVLRHSVGALQMVRTSVTAIKNTSCLLVNNTGAIWTLTLCNFQSTTSEAAALPIVCMESNVSFPTGVSMCGFLYTSITTKDKTVSTGIKFGGSTGQQLVLVNVLFGLSGLGYGGYAVDVSGSAVHQVLVSNSGCYPLTAYALNAPVAQLVKLTPILS